MIRLSLCSAEDIVISQFNVISLISFFLYSLCLPDGTLYGILARRAAESNLGPRYFLEFGIKKDGDTAKTS